MKFRIDSVTNSSESSYLVFNIKNPELFKFFTELGVRFRNVDKNEFSNRMYVLLPSFTSGNIDSEMPLPRPDDYSSISAWLVCYIFLMRDSDDEFCDELFELINKASISKGGQGWEHIDDDFFASFDHWDGDIEDAVIESAEGFEDECQYCYYTSVHNGQRESIGDIKPSYSEYVKKEECKGKIFALEGVFQFFKDRNELIEEISSMEGMISDSVTENTDYLISNDIRSDLPQIKKARELGIAVLSEASFVRRFCKKDKVTELLDDGNYFEDAKNLSWDGGVFDYTVENGAGPVIMEVWKDGKWQRNSPKDK